MCGCAGKTVRSFENTCHTRALLRSWYKEALYQVYAPLPLKQSKHFWSMTYIVLWAEAVGTVLSYAKLCEWLWTAELARMSQMCIIKGLYTTYINDNDCGSEGQCTGSSDSKLGITLWATRICWQRCFLCCVPEPARFPSLHSTLRESIQYRNNSEVRAVNRICRPRVMLLRTIKRYKAKSSKKKLNRNDIEW